MSRLGRITYGRTTEMLDIPRPDYSESLKSPGFEELVKAKHPAEDGGDKAVM
jgi:hypothetical protein